MGGQIFGGGVIVLVAAALWMVYLLPSWHSRHRFDAAERNAIRLNQALRVLAESAETPREVQVELTARTALAQQKLARRVQHEREQERLEVDRRRLAEARREARVARAQTADLRRSQARRRVRLVAAVAAAASLGLAGWGIFLALSTGASVVLWSATAAFAVAALVLRQLAVVARRAVARPAAQTAPQAAATVAAAPQLQDLAVADVRLTWTPRELPRPLTASAGSQAAAVLDEVDAREALRQAAVAEAIRDEAARRQPASLEATRAARTAEPDFARMGVVDDREIEDHVRRLLQQRAAG